MIPVILAGGSGRRLWPISNNIHRKPFYKFFRQSFLEMSLNRLSDFPSPLIVASESMKLQVEELACKTAMKTVYEPESKNTAPAIALVCHLLKKQKREKEVAGFFPVDHYFHPREKFHKLISFGEHLALSEKRIVTLGLPPKKPLPGYGYIRVKKLHVKKEDISIYKSDSFLEKPDTKKAQMLIKKGSCFWNSGIFISPVDLLIDYFKEYLPKLWKIMEKIPEDLQGISHYYKNVEPTSFDKGIMENINEYLALSADLEWRDLGSWDDIADLYEEKDMKLGIKTSIISEDSHGNFVFSQKSEPIGLIGVNNSLIVNGLAGLLIAKRGTAQNIKGIVDSFKKKGNECPENKTPFVLKPWGQYEVLYSSLHFKVKLLYVNPNERLSYQSHKKRREHWIIVSGTGEMTLSEKVQKIKVEDYIVISQGQKHRLKNTGEKPLIVLEIQFGVSCEEKDIIRHEDDYNR